LKVIPIKIENPDKKLCVYGCGLIAKYKLKNGNICCNDNLYRCPILREKNSKSKIGRKRSKEQREKISKSHIGQKSTKKGKTYKEFYGEEKEKEIKLKLRKNNKVRFTLNRIKEHYKILLEFEELREDPSDNLKVQGRCKNENCKNNKENNGWFTLTSSQISERIRNLKTNSKSNLYFFCCDECKKTSKYYYENRTRYSDEDIKKFNFYKESVYKETRITISKYKNLIENIELRGRNYHLDHIFSIIDGFNNNVDPKIIAHVINLRIVNYHKNCSKHKRSDITLNELLKKIEKFEDDNKIGGFK